MVSKFYLQLYNNQELCLNGPMVDYGINYFDTFEYSFILANFIDKAAFGSACNLYAWCFCGRIVRPETLVKLFLEWKIFQDVSSD